MIKNTPLSALLINVKLLSLGDDMEHRGKVDKFIFLYKIYNILVSPQINLSVNCFDFWGVSDKAFSFRIDLDKFKIYTCRYWKNNVNFNVRKC